jgi:hypothetical protein
MTRLIVEEGGACRAFKISEGVIAIGSGAEARLKLTSPDVAARHATLELLGGVCTLRAEPGVVPPTVGGVPVRGDVELAAGVPVRIGSATLVLEADAGPAARAAAAPPVVPRPVERRPPSSSRSARRGPARGGRDDAEAREPRKISHGIPAWLIVAPLVVVISLVGFFIVRVIMSNRQEVAPDLAMVYFNNAVAALERNKLDTAEFELDRIPTDKVSPEVAARIAQLRAQIASDRQAGELALHNMRGTTYLDQSLKRFERSYLLGPAEPPKVRLFLKRCRHFRETWPQHEELGWVERQERRFAGVVDLSQPPTLADIQFEVRTLTHADDLRDYEQCFQVLDQFLGVCGPADREAALKLVDEHRAAREPYFLDRLQRARFEYERKEIAESAGVLVALIRYIGDEQMADRAASELLKFEDIDARLRGFKLDKPEILEELKANRVMGEYIRSKGLE